MRICSFPCISALRMFALATLTSFLMTGCKKDSDTIVFEDTVSFDSFPKTIKAAQGEKIDFGSVGNLEFRIVDTLMVINTAQEENGWKIASLRSDSIIGSMISVGHGNSEFDMVPLVSTANITGSGDDIHAIIADNARGKYIDLDISASLDSSSTILSRIPSDNLSPTALTGYRHGDDVEMVYIMDMANNCIRRSLVLDGKIVGNKSIDYLNTFSVETPDRIGILMPRMALNPDKQRIVEMMGLYPQINIYSFDGSESVSIMPYGRTRSIRDVPSDMESMVKMNEYGWLVGYEDFFAVNKLGETNDEIWLFSWDGKPIAEIDLPEKITSFDMDLENMDLYTLDFHTDTFKKYHLPELAESIGALNKQD